MLEVGNKVKIKSWKEVVERDRGYSLIVDSMENKTNSIGEITEISNWGNKKIYKVKGWWWHSNMFSLIDLVENKQYLLEF